MTHLSKLAWLEIKIFLREPLGAIGTILFPVIIYLVLGKLLGDERETSAFVRDLPVMATMLVAIGGVTSLIAIVSIYREGGILKRLRATPLTPLTILSAHVVVKMFFTGVTLVLTNHHIGSTMRMADQIVFLVQRKALSGTVEEMPASEDPRLRAFLDSASPGELDPRVWMGQESEL